MHKMFKTRQNFRVGHIPAHLTCHLATKTVDLWGHPVQKKDGKDRQSVWSINYAPQHQKDDTGVPINRCLQSPDLVKRVINLFPAACFGVKKVLVFSSGESCGWVAPLALEMGFDCICTEPDTRQFETLVTRLNEGMPSYTAKLTGGPGRKRTERQGDTSGQDKSSFASGASTSGGETVRGSWDDVTSRL